MELHIKMDFRNRINCREKDPIGILFVVHSTFTYKTLLGWDWIHINSSIPTSLHQVLIIWNVNNHGEKAVDIVKADVKPFVINSNNLEVQFYDEYY